MESSYTLCLSKRNSSCFRVFSFILIICVYQTAAVAQTTGQLLQKKINLQIDNLSISDALSVVGEKAGCSFAYSSTQIKANKKVSLQKNDISVYEAVQELLDYNVHQLKVNGNQVFIQADRGKGTIKGKVSTSDGKPAENVSVIIKGTSKGDITDENGAFEIPGIPAGPQTVVVSYTGLETQQIQVQVVEDKTVKSEIVLSENASTMQEVIVKSGGRGYLKGKVSPSLRIQTPLMETPQNIVVISNEVLKDQQVFTATDITRNVSGVTTLYPYVNTYTDFAIRGTRATNNKMRNGVPTSIPYLGIEEDMSYVENVEFIKGPAGFMLSHGEPGGMYNVVTKKPLRTEKQSVELSTGSYGLFRVSTDITGPIGKKLFYRLNTMGRKSGTQVDFSENNRFSIAPVIRYEFDDKTSLTLEYNGDFLSLRGVDPTVSTWNGKFLPRNFAVEDPAIPATKLTSHYGLANLNHAINANWNFTAQISVIRQISDRYNMTSRSPISAEGILPRQYREAYAKGTTVTGQLFVNGNFNTGSVNHKLMLGYDAGKQQASNSSVFMTNLFPLNVNNPVYNLTKLSFDTLNKAAATSYSPTSIVEWQALYLQDVISPLPWLQLTLAGRYTYYNFGSPKLLKENVFTPRFGLLIMPLPNTSIYGLYDRAFIAQAGQTFNKEDFKPLHGDNIEFGIKREWLDRRLFTQVAYFNITKKNALTADPVNTGFSIQTGEIKSKGVEVDIMGSLSKNFNIITNYAYTDVRVTADTDASLVGSRQQTPLHTFNAWLRYRVLSGPLKGLGIGAGYSYHKSRYVLAIKKDPTDLNYTTLPDFKSLNAALYYTLGRLSLSANIDNIANSFNAYGYFDRRNGTSGEYYYMSMPGRNIRISAGYRF